MRLGISFVAAAALLAGCGGGDETAEPANEAGNAAGNEAFNAVLPEMNAALPEANEAAPVAEEVPASENAAAAAAPKEAEKTAAAEAKEAPKAAAAEETPPPVKMASATVPSEFSRCRVCHSVEPGRHGVGPSLAGVFGAKAGTRPGYNYSDAMKNSGITGSGDRLDAFIAAPRAVVPGTKMVIAGPKDAAARQRLVDYLASLR